MTHLPEAEIDLAGQSHLEKWLQNNNFKKLKTYNAEGQFPEIEADGNMENILVGVKTIIAPEPADHLNDADKARLLKKAARLDRVAYVAYVTIDVEKQLAGEIIWEKLRLLH